MLLSRVVPMLGDAQITSLHIGAGVIRARGVEPEEIRRGFAGRLGRYAQRPLSLGGELVHKPPLPSLEGEEHPANDAARLGDLELGHPEHRPVQPSIVLAAVQTAARRLRRWPAASLDRGCARRSANRQVGAKGWVCPIEQRDANFDLSSAGPPPMTDLRTQLADVVSRT